MTESPSSFPDMFANIKSNATFQKFASIIQDQGTLPEGHLETLARESVSLAADLEILQKSSFAGIPQVAEAIVQFYSPDVPEHSLDAKALALDSLCAIFCDTGLSNIQNTFLLEQQNLDSGAVNLATSSPERLANTLTLSLLQAQIQSSGDQDKFREFVERITDTENDLLTNLKAKIERNSSHIFGRGDIATNRRENLLATIDSFQEGINSPTLEIPEVELKALSHFQSILAPLLSDYWTALQSNDENFYQYLRNLNELVFPIRSAHTRQRESIPNISGTFSTELESGEVAYNGDIRNAKYKVFDKADNHCGFYEQLYYPDIRKELGQDQFENGYEFDSLIELVSNIDGAVISMDTSVSESATRSGLEGLNRNYPVSLFKPTITDTFDIANDAVSTRGDKRYTILMRFMDGTSRELPKEVGEDEMMLISINNMKKILAPPSAITLSFENNPRARAKQVIEIFESLLFPGKKVE